MKEQTIIVTGATTEIGKQIARHFLENGENVVISSLAKDNLSKVFDELGGGENLAMVAGDVRDKVTGIRLLAMAVGKFGSADVLVNNPDVLEARSFFNVDESYLDRFLNTNFKGTFFTTQAIVPQMLKQHSGVVVNIGVRFESDVLEGGTTLSPMNAKESIHLLTMQLVSEFGKYKIRFNTIAPSPLHGQLNQITGFYASNRKKEMKEIAQIVYMFSKSKCITGSIINMDCGMNFQDH